MSVLTKAFWKTLWSDWKYWVVAGLIVLTLIYGVYSWFQMKRSWNWQVGGYKARAVELVCEMVKPEALTPKYAKKCK